MAHMPRTFTLEVEVQGMTELTDLLLDLQNRVSTLEARLDDPEGEGV